jgi:hypothetical protein
MSQQMCSVVHKQSILLPKAELAECRKVYRSVAPSASLGMLMVIPPNDPHWLARRR